MIRAVRLAAALLFACLGLVVTVQAPAAAECTCKPGTLEQQVERAEAVFIATVDNVELAGNDHTYDVTASRAYEGSPERSTQVFSAGGRNACGLGELGVGTSYVFLATGTEAPFEADSCSGTSVANPTKVAKIEALLGEGTAVIAPPDGDMGAYMRTLRGLLHRVEVGRAHQRRLLENHMAPGLERRQRELEMARRRRRDDGDV